MGYAPGVKWDPNRLRAFLNLLVRDGLLQDGQRQDVLNRGAEQARHIILDKRADLRRLTGRRRVDYDVSEIEIIASFRLRRADEPETVLDEETVTRRVASELSVDFTVLDPLQLDYQTITSSFGGPFAERHLILAIEETPQAVVLAMAAPWDEEVLDGLAQAKGKTIHPVMVTKSQILQIIVEFHGFRRSMQAAEAEYRRDGPDLGNLEQLHALEDVTDVDPTARPVVQAVWFILQYAFEQRASDIHLEPRRNECWVR
ncbi:MAG: type II/IV secretion system protein, partial [Myxococcota bacterium]